MRCVISNRHIIYTIYKVDILNKQLQYPPLLLTQSLKAGLAMRAQDEARNRRHSKPDADPPPLPPPAMPPPPGGDEPELESDPLGIPEVQPSHRMKVLKTVVNVTIDKVTRKFPVSLYGTVQLAMLAASQYEESADRVVCDFEKYRKKPQQRHELLVNLGWEPTKDSRRKVDDQLQFARQRMSNGKVDWMEKDIFRGMLKLLLPNINATICHEPAGFAVTWQSDNHQMNKNFKSFDGAFKWLQEMEQSNKASGLKMMLVAIQVVFLFYVVSKHNR